MCSGKSIGRYIDTILKLAKEKLGKSSLKQRANGGAMPPKAPVIAKVEGFEAETSARIKSETIEQYWQIQRERNILGGSEAIFSRDVGGL